MKDYKNGKIYVIKSPNTEKIYIGSTCLSLAGALKNHKKDYYKYNYSGYIRLYRSSFHIIDAGDAYIELIQDYPCESQKELEILEGVYQKLNKKNCVNLKIAGLGADKVIECECGQLVCRKSLKRHQQTKIHSNLLQNKSDAILNE